MSIKLDWVHHEPFHVVYEGDKIGNNTPLQVYKNTYSMFGVPHVLCAHSYGFSRWYFGKVPLPSKITRPKSTFTHLKQMKLQDKTMWYGNFIYFDVVDQMVVLEQQDKKFQMKTHPTFAYLCAPFPCDDGLRKQILQYPGIGKSVKFAGNLSENCDIITIGENLVSCVAILYTCFKVKNSPTSKKKYNWIDYLSKMVDIKKSTVSNLVYTSTYYGCLKKLYNWIGQDKTKILTTKAKQIQKTTVVYPDMNIIEENSDLPPKFKWAHNSGLNNFINSKTKYSNRNPVGMLNQMIQLVGDPSLADYESGGIAVFKNLENTMFDGFELFKIEDKFVVRLSSGAWDEPDKGVFFSAVITDSKLKDWQMRKLMFLYPKDVVVDMLAKKLTFKGDSFSIFGKIHLAFKMMKNKLMDVKKARKLCKKYVNGKEKYGEHVVKDLQAINKLIRI